MLPTAGEAISKVCGLNDPAIALVMLTHREASLMLLILDVELTLGVSDTFEFEGV